jgi:glycogen debranching enzyme
MDAKVNGEVITPRIGKPVEVNALWCVALRNMVCIAELCGEPSEGYRDLAAAAERGFQRFWNAAAGWCFDVLDQPDGSHDGALRPNQLLTVALMDGLLSAEQARQVVAVCGQQLLKPVGLRSLDPRHPGYQGHYGGSPLVRDRAYHQGTVWGWWLGPYALAHGRVHGVRRLLCASWRPWAITSQRPVWAASARSSMATLPTGQGVGRWRRCCGLGRSSARQPGGQAGAEAAPTAMAASPRRWISRA